MILVAIISFVIVLAFFIFFDYRKWVKQTDVKHKTEWYIKAACLSPSAGFFTFAASNDWYFVFPIVCGMIGAWWWSFFDGPYNLLRGFGWSFNGSPIGKANDSWIDKWLRKLQPWQDAVVKWSAIILFTFVYIKLYQ